MKQHVLTKRWPHEQVRENTQRIHSRILAGSPNLDAGNFKKIHPTDLERMFDLYDDYFFNGTIRKLLADSPLAFRLSKRMTRTAGQVSRREKRHRDGELARTQVEYEIAVSATLLFQSFQENHRPIIMSGIECRDRLEALQRVMEHEMTHLVEMLIWKRSSCSAPRFQSIAVRFFGHTDHRHQLITPREAAFTQFGVRPGDHVAFRLDGQVYNGIVNRITKRATVLVEDRRGERYSNGKRYTKFYVPVAQLERVREKKIAKKPAVRAFIQRVARRTGLANIAHHFPGKDPETQVRDQDPRSHEP